MAHNSDVATRAVRPDTPHLCFVCGLDLGGVDENAPWGDSGIDPTFEFCPCCGTEFGYQDATLEAARAQRTRWADDGYRWMDDSRKPSGWDATRQLSGLPERVR